jgi:site-specific DNA-methyltransferase (adenine-specific)
MKKLPDKSVDLILTDPPYGVTKCRWDNKISLSKMWKSFSRIIKDKTAILITGTQPFASELVVSNIKMFRYDLIWRKRRITGHLNAKRIPLREHETILVFYDKLPTYNPQMVDSKGHIRGAFGKRKNYSEVYNEFNDDKKEMVYQYYPRSTFEICAEMQSIHPTQKPVALMKYFIKTYTNKDNTVLDPFMGSGTTGVACKELGRNFIGIEIKENYFDMATRRIKNTTKGVFF